MTDAEHVARLTRLGLTSYEARAYLALAGSESLTATEAARVSGLPRQRIYDVLEGLVRRGLVATISGRVARFAALAPREAVDRLLAELRAELASREAEAALVAADLQPLFETVRQGRTSRCAGVVLAAGNSVRFGASKMLALLDGRPLLQHVLDLAAGVGLEPVVVVLGHNAAAVRQACTWRDETVVVNPGADARLSDSVKLGLAQLALEPTERALILLADQPRLTAAQVRTLIDLPRDPKRPIVVPLFGSEPGSPVLLERAAWQLAVELRGDQGMSQLFSARPNLVHYVQLAGTNPDVDTPADLERLGGGS